MYGVHIYKYLASLLCVVLNDKLSLAYNTRCKYGSRLYDHSGIEM